MSLRKRRASDASQPTVKRACIETADSQLDQQEITSPPDLPESSGDFKIEIKLRSTSKAARNDPEFTQPQREQYQKILSEQSNGGPTTQLHHFAAYLTVTKSSPYHDDDEPDDQVKVTPDDGDASNIDDDGSCENTTFNIEGAGKRIDIEKSQKDHLVTGEEVEQNDCNAEDESDDDIDENELSLENDDDEYDIEDEVRSEFDPDFEFKWLEPIDVEVLSTISLDDCGKPMSVAYCHAKLIRRNQMRDDFYGEMEPPSRETSMLAFDLFDRYGRLRSEFKAHPFIKGTGIWGKELDHGDLLLIEDVFVKKDYRRQGLGRRMIESLLKLVREKTWSFFAFVWPTMLRCQDIRLEWDSLPDDAARYRMADREEDRAVVFCRSLGFRRVGSTTWLALAPEDDHPSRQLASTEDFNPPETPLIALHPLLSPFQQIGNATPTTPDQPLNTSSRECPDFLGVLHNCMQETGSADGCWTSTDKDGNSVLHLVAKMFNVACVDWILKQDFSTRLLETRNNNGETPLESLQFKLENLRTRMVTINGLTVPVSDRFEGHNDDAVRCLLLLQGLGSVESMVKLKGRNALQQIIRGCTCGQCLKGFLSPRMSYALQCQAHHGYDMMSDDFDEPLGQDWVER
nr:hypothetical protein LTR18_007100 [Exophiala xenobiotica]